MTNLLKGGLALICPLNFGRELRRQSPYPNIGTTEDGRGQVADVREHPPVGVALVPYPSFTDESGTAGNTIHHIVIQRANDATRPQSHIIPFGELCQNGLIAMPHNPCGEVVIFCLTKLLGNAHRATPTCRKRQTITVLHTLQPRHDQDGVCPVQVKALTIGIRSSP